MKYWDRLVTLATKYAEIGAVRERLDAVVAARSAIKNQQLPAHQLPKLEIPLAAYALAGSVSNGSLTEMTALSHMFGNFRWYIAYHYGVWAYITADLIQNWTTLFPDRRYLEVAAGNGLLSAGLRAAGQQVISTDALTWVAENGTGRTPWTPVVKATATEALWQHGQDVDAVIMAWGPDKDINDLHLLRTLRNDFPHLEFFCIGNRFGITNSQAFWRTAHLVPDRRLLKLNQTFKKFDKVGDHIYLID